MVLLWGYEKNRNTTLVFENNSNENKNPLLQNKTPFSQCKKGVFGRQKGGFATQKYGCCNVLSIRRLCKRVVFAKH